MGAGATRAKLPWLLLRGADPQIAEPHFLAVVLQAQVAFGEPLGQLWKLLGVGIDDHHAVERDAVASAAAIDLHAVPLPCLAAHALRAGGDGIDTAAVLIVLEVGVAG